MFPCDSLIAFPEPETGKTGKVPRDGIWKRGDKTQKDGVGIFWGGGDQGYAMRFGLKKKLKIPILGHLPRLADALTPVRAGRSGGCR